MILRKSLDGDEILGLKVVGGQPTPSGRRVAYIEKVKPDSVAELEGHLKPGKHKGYSTSQVRAITSGRRFVIRASTKVCDYAIYFVLLENIEYSLKYILIVYICNILLFNVMYYQHWVIISYYCFA